MLDTRDKRASALARRLWYRMVPPSPDGAISAADRAHLAGLYRGIEIAEEVIPDFIPPPVGAASSASAATAAVTFPGASIAAVISPGIPIATTVETD